jgi:hypothetical protein
MECIKKLNSFEEIQELVSKIQERRIFNCNIIEHYRGQGRPEYKLIPYISRNLVKANEVQLREAELINGLKKALKENNLESILRMDENLNNNQNLWNILIQAQHLGVPTRFLDWSLKWEVGLWFAVENSDNDNVDGQFWVFSVPNEIHPTDTRDNFYNKDLYNLDKTYLINATIYWSDDLKNQIGEIKRQRQYGKFSVSSFEKSLITLENQSEINSHLEKYCIPSAAKGQIRLKLASLGLHKEWLYYREANTEILEKVNKIIQEKTSP